jgi:hypothetical protein
VGGLNGKLKIDGRRFIILAEERLAAFLELHAAIHRQLNRVKIG